MIIPRFTLREACSLDAANYAGSSSNNPRGGSLALQNFSSISLEIIIVSKKGKEDTAVEISLDNRMMHSFRSIEH
jgi:hypothetical protein